jgi:hypothetical protein
MLEIVTSVDDDGQVFGWKKLGESVGQFRSADTARECDDFHP